jgi:large subunit ribosomal protein L35
MTALRIARLGSKNPGHAVAILERSITSFRRERRLGKAVLSRRSKESKMPKQKTKSGAKKRFRFTANGHVKVGPAGKRHGMIKRTTKFIRKARGTMVLSDSDERIVKKYMPYNR